MAYGYERQTVQTGNICIPSEWATRPQRQAMCALLFDFGRAAQTNTVGSAQTKPADQ